MLESHERTFREAGLSIQPYSQVKIEDQMTCSWRAASSPEKHQRLVRLLFDNPDIRELKC
jgi:hypothetical protein